MNHSLIYTYERGKVQCQCSCGWQTRKHFNTHNGNVNLSRKVAKHEARAH